MRSKITLLFLISCLTGFSVQNSIATTKVLIVDGCSSKALKERIEMNASMFLNDLYKSFKNKNVEIQFSTEDISIATKEEVISIWNSSRFYCPEVAVSERLIQSSTGYEIRNIPVKVDSLDEEIVLGFDTKGVITDMYFSVSQHRYRNVLDNNTVVDETRRNIIRNFLEALRTAYIKKDINFIDTVYSDKALIIVGRKIKRTQMNDFKVMDTDKRASYERGKVDDVKYEKKSKARYMTELKDVFAKNKNIFVGFSNIQIAQHRKVGYESFYEIKLTQRWKANEYSDYGYLFFLIQFRENDYPLIWVRVWQDATNTPENERVGLGDILIQPN